jgi:transcriptional activator SPT8
MGYRLFGSYLVINLERSPLFVFPNYYEEVDVDVDATCRFMLTAGGNRGWGGSTTEVVMGYDINVVP